MRSSMYNLPIINTEDDTPPKKNMKKVAVKVINVGMRPTPRQLAQHLQLQGDAKKIADQTGLTVAVVTKALKGFDINHHTETVLLTHYPIK